MEKKQQKERGVLGAGIDVDNMGIGGRQEIGFVEDEHLDEKYMCRAGSEAADEFEKDVKVLERSVKSMEL